MYSKQYHGKNRDMSIKLFKKLYFKYNSIFIQQILHSPLKCFDNTKISQVLLLVKCEFNLKSFFGKTQNSSYFVRFFVNFFIL